MRIQPVFLSAIAALTIAGCSDAEPVSEPQDTAEAGVDVSEQDEAAEPELSPVEVGDSTPMAERVATIGLLNKRNNVSQDFEMRPGEVVEEGAVILRLQACERTAPYEFPQETGAFVQVDVLERGQSEHARVFSGWLFKENPSLNIVEHPVYDVWIKDCAMSFPGDE
ncbi:DUF2155 domain-containing protein [Erythrobacter sp. Alg231-14]|uniref:DUF2155 domain-containing protein n=1 Tax=Erythrobacter sp. Alg231-14 TaxID=1922225 RepID=UPI000D561E60